MRKYGIDADTRHAYPFDFLEDRLSTPRPLPEPTGTEPEGAQAPLPVPERLGIDHRFTGRGVVVAFLDSGFYAHPDLTQPENRIREYVDLATGRSGPRALSEPDVSSWHGMMSSVVAGGNGMLSGGRYRSHAPEIGLVLVKVGNAARIKHDDITRGIAWVVENRDRHGIRVLNISCGGDHEASYLVDGLSQMAEQAVREGIVVVCAVGNHGERPGYVLPPASTPAVISVGGLNDLGDPSLGRLLPYRSSFGPTVDGIQKPEVITLADFLPAPILPGTSTKREAELLTMLDAAPDSDLTQIMAENRGVFGPLDALEGKQPYLIRELVAAGLRDGLVIDEHYKKVDGTSFAAPIVSSIVAQMLEANPGLAPGEVKRILMRTAARVPGIELERQGWGVVRPEAAVEAALQAR
jgi:serine protease AprX